MHERAETLDTNRSGDERSHRCDSDNVTLLLRNHRRQECIDSKVVRDGVDIKDTADLFRRGLQDVSLKGDTRIVDQNARVAILCTNGIGSSIHSLHRSDVALEVVDLLVRLHVCGKRVVDIESHHSDTLRSKAFRDETSKTATSSGNDCDFSWPVISVLFRLPSEVVLCQLGEEVIDHGKQAESEEPFERYHAAGKDCLRDIWFQSLQDWLLDVFWCSCEYVEQWASDYWVEEGVLDESCHDEGRGG